MKAFIYNGTNLAMGEVSSIVHWTLDQDGLNLEMLGVHLDATLKPMHTGRFMAIARQQVPPPAELREFPPAVKHVITGSIPYVPLGPNYRGVEGGPRPYLPLTWQECLVCLIAHEAYHLEEWLNRPTGNFDEVAAEWREYERWLQWNERRKPK